MASFFGLGTSSTVIKITLDGDADRPKGKLFPSDASAPLVGIYAGQDAVSGTCEVITRTRTSHLQSLYNYVSVSYAYSII